MSATPPTTTPTNAAPPTAAPPNTVPPETTPRQRTSLPGVGGWPFLITSFVGRMPSSMVQLGYLMVLAADGRGMATAGLAVAAAGLGTAVGAPVVGRLVDRFGPLPVLASATIVSLAGQLTFLALLLNHASSWPMLACAGLVGAANPQVGPVARTRWSQLAVRTNNPGLVSRALGYEGMVDELGFVVGPVLASLLVSLAGAVPATIAIAVATLVGQGAFLAHLAADRDGWRATHAEHAQTSDGGRVGFSALWPMLATLGVGTLFGATQTGLTSVFDQRGTPELTGLVYACVGVGSGVASLLVGRVSARIPVWARVLTGSVLMGIGALGLLQLPPAGLAAVFALVGGAGAGACLVSAFTWMERIAPRERMATMMTVLATCITLGVSAGAAVAGRLAEVPAHSFWPVLVASGLAALASLGMLRNVSN